MRDDQLLVFFCYLEPRWHASQESLWFSAALFLTGCGWALNPRAYRELAPFGRTVGIPFLLLAVALAVSGLGWLKRQRWGWQLAVFIIVIQVFGDFVNVFCGHLVQGGVGIAMAGALLFYMLRPNIRAAFATEQQISDN